MLVTLRSQTVIGLSLLPLQADQAFLGHLEILDHPEMK